MHSRFLKFISKNGGNKLFTSVIPKSSELKPSSPEQFKKVKINFLIFDRRIISVKPCLSYHASGIMNLESHLRIAIVTGYLHERKTVPNIHTILFEKGFLN